MSGFLWKVCVDCGAPVSDEEAENNKPMCEACVQYYIDAAYAFYIGADVEAYLPEPGSFGKAIQEALTNGTPDADGANVRGKDKVPRISWPSA
jgi:hypothetical protein